MIFQLREVQVVTILLCCFKSFENVGFFFFFLVVEVNMVIISIIGLSGSSLSTTWPLGLPHFREQHSLLTSSHWYPSSEPHTHHPDTNLHSVLREQGLRVFYK